MSSSSIWIPARAVLLVLSACGCAPGDGEGRRLGQLVFEDGERSPAPVAAGASLSGGPLYFAARNAEGAVVVAAADTGEIVAAASSPDPELRPVDLVFDPYRARFVAVDDDAEGSLSVARAHGLGWTSSLAPVLAPAVDLGHLEGRLRFAAAPAGLVAFQESYGKRWKLWSESGVPTPSVAAPRPDSVWSTVRGDGVFRIGGLAVENDGTIARVEAPIDDAGVGDLSVAAVSGPWTEGPSSPSARMAVSARTGQSVLAAVVDGRAWVRPFVDLSAEESMLLDVSATRIEHVALLRADRVVLLLLSGPTRLVALYQQSPVGMAVLDVPAEVHPADTYFSRELLVLGDGPILLATDRGILSVRLEEGASGLKTAPSDPLPVANTVTSGGAGGEGGSGNNGGSGACEGSDVEIVEVGTSPSLLLRGRVVSPSQSYEGEVLINGNTIACAGQSCSSEPGATGATIVDTHGIILPGLIDTHNHILFDIFDEDDWAPEMTYTNHDQWPNEERYGAMVDTKQWLNGEHGSPVDVGCEMLEYGAWSSWSTANSTAPATQAQAAP